MGDAEVVTDDHGCEADPVPYAEELAERVRAVVGPIEELTEVKMFGGLGFLVRGNLACGVHGEDLIVRLDPDEGDRLIATGPHARPMDLSGRPMRGWLLIEPAALTSAKRLGTWVGRGVEYASALPPKAQKTKKKTR